MKKLLFALIVYILLSAPMLAATTYPPNARYVIVNPNSNLSAQYIFLLDTKSGKTWQFVKDEEGYFVWEQKPYIWVKQDGSYGGYTFKAPIVIAP